VKQMSYSESPILSIHDFCVMLKKIETPTSFIYDF
jgi:hypothetical protein